MNVVRNRNPSEPGPRESKYTTIFGFQHHISRDHLYIYMYYLLIFYLFIYICIYMCVYIICRYRSYMHTSIHPSIHTYIHTYILLSSGRLKVETTCLMQTKTNEFWNMGTTIVCTRTCHSEVRRRNLSMETQSGGDVTGWIKTVSTHIHKTCTEERL